MSVVDQHRHWALLGVSREQAERGCADREALLRWTGPERERALKGHRLRLRDPLNHRQSGADEL